MLIATCRLVSYNLQPQFNAKVSHAQAKTVLSFASYSMRSRCTNYNSRARMAPPFSQCRGNRCDRVAWYAFFTFATCTLLAQVVLTLRLGAIFVAQRLCVDILEFCRRIYAVTLRNTPITIGFAIITASQFALGIWATALSAREGGIVKLLHCGIDPHLR